MNQLIPLFRFAVSVGPFSFERTGLSGVRGEALARHLQESFGPVRRGSDLHVRGAVRKPSAPHTWLTEAFWDADGLQVRMALPEFGSRTVTASVGDEFSFAADFTVTLDGGRFPLCVVYATVNDHELAPTAFVAAELAKQHELVDALVGATVKSVDRWETEERAGPNWEQRWAERNRAWQQELTALSLAPEDRRVMAYLGPSWYPSTYACPRCRGTIYKTVFALGQEYPMLVSGDGGGLWEAKRAFTCPRCLTVSIAKPGHQLRERASTFDHANERQYLQRIRNMGSVSTTEGRQDL